MLDAKNSRFDVNHVTELPASGEAATLEPSLQEYRNVLDVPESYVISLRHLTHEAFPRIDLYRNAQSVQGVSRPSLDELHNDIFTIKTDNRKGSQVDGSNSHHKFGWIQGVLILNLMNLWGPMLFLRSAWLVGQGGIIEACVVILFSSLITTITALSTSAIATNGEVKGGGTYYMLSRSLGPEYGGAIGLVFAFANMVGVALNIVGFCESFQTLLQTFNLKIIDSSSNDIRIIGIITVIFCVVICLVGMEWEQKAQNLLLLILLTAISDVFVGSFLPPSIEAQAKGITGWRTENFKDNAFSKYRHSVSFVYIFSVYFPSATGILAGANISGELKDPQYSIPRGTLLAILLTTISYLMFAIIAGGCIIRDASGHVDDFLIYKNYTDCSTTNPCEWGLYSSSIMENVAGFPWLVYAGNFAATISSALACLVGAPRVFQALCRDKIYPYIYWFEKGYGKSDDPIRCYALTFVIALAFILIADLNAIAPIMSNFFMAAFCLINFACFHAAMAKSPGFRPGFRFWNMWVSFFGAILCFVVMFVMDWRWAILTIVVCFLLYIYIYFNKPNVNWGSSAQAETYRQALRSTLDLNQIEEHVKNYRPQILVLTGRPIHRPPLVDLAYSITKGISLMVCGDVTKQLMSQKDRLEIQRKMNHWLIGRKIRAFYSVTDEESLEKGARALVQLVGVGKLRPNMVMMGFKQNWSSCNSDETEEYVNIIHDALDMHMAVAILRLQKGLDYSFFTENEEIESPKPWIKTMNGSYSFDSGLDLNSRSESVNSFVDTRVQTSDSKENVCEAEEKKKKKKNTGRRKSLANNIPKEIVDEIDRFRAYKRFKGVIDVWWLYDDGGLTLLIPHILTARKSWHKCKLRVFSLANRRNQIDEEQRNLANLLSKFRIDYQDVIMIPDVTKSPRESTIKEFEEIMSKHLEISTEEGTLRIEEEDVIAYQDKSNRHMRVHELLLENSLDSSLIVMTLPMPKKRFPAALYMSWMEILTKGLPPCLLVRGNQTSVLTFYS